MFTIDLCNDILTDEKLLLSDADTKKINESQSHINEINRYVQTLIIDLGLKS